MLNLQNRYSGESGESGESSESGESGESNGSGEAAKYFLTFLTVWNNLTLHNFIFQLSMTNARSGLLQDKPGKIFIILQPLSCFILKLPS